MKLDDRARSLILSELMDCVEVLVLILDSGLKVLEANRGAAAFLGYPADDLIAKRLSSLIDAREWERLAEPARDAKERIGGKTVFLTRSRRRMPVRFSLCPFPEAGGRPRCYLLVCRYADEKDFPPSIASNGLVERMLGGFDDPLLILDAPSRKVIDCNRAAIDSFGFAREELVGDRIVNRFPSAAERQRTRTVEARADKAYATAGIFQERILFPRKNAPSLPCDLIGLPCFGPNASLVSIIVMLFDRSSDEEREAELAHLIKQVGDLTAELASLASGYSAKGKAKRLSDLGFTSRQIEIARLGATGASSKEIGFRLGIAESTVKNHLAAMYRKLGVSSRISFIRAVSAKHIKIE
jgi:DNA-binding CsgD family transcriptional regulator/PAS domain-containing protein